MALEPAMTRTVLALDTSTPAVIVGVLHRHGDGRIDTLIQRTAVDAHAHAELLTPNILAAVADAGLKLGGVDAVVVGSGPGPFTGLRVGMATAAAYGHALDVPVYGVCSLDAIGNQTRGEVLVVTDARRREVYWERYRDGIRIDGPDVAAPADVPVGAAENVAGSPAHCELFGLPRIEPAQPVPAGLVHAVADWEGTPDPLVPLYLRRPDAKTLAERGLLR
jgi:tRNA threonylcarbamoyl adenosine modification protein YeaZ